MATKMRDLVGGSLWSWGKTATPLTPPDETWGELSLRRPADGRWILGGFLSSEYALGYRVVKSPTAVRAAPLQHPIVGSEWDDEHHARMALSGNAIPRDAARHYQIVTCRR